MKRRVRIFLFALTALVAAGFLVPGDRYFEIARSLDIFATLFKEINSNYVDEVDPAKLTNDGIRSMLETLDPYTEFISEEDAEEFNVQTTGQYAGIGALIIALDNRVYIRQPYEGLPAHRAGARVGDEIVSIDGRSVKGFDTDQVISLLKGSPRTQVNMVVRRAGVARDINLSLVREQIKLPAVTDHRKIDSTVGYIRLDEFTFGASSEVEKAFRELQQQGMKSLVLDLRGNPGGLMYEAIRISNMFLPKNKEIVSTRGRLAESNATYRTQNEPLDTSIPLVVLVDANSASASEIVAGSLQDYDRAVLIGQRTFGKGLVQTTQQLPYNTQLKITTARYYIPSGRCIQELNYAKRDKDGLATMTADSAKRKFKTAAGRLVRDGGGLDPDIPVAFDVSGELMEALMGEIFLFSNNWCATHPQPPDLAGFRLSDKDFELFRSFLAERKFQFTPFFAGDLDKVEAAARQRQAWVELEGPVAELRKRMREIGPELINIYAEEIRSQIGYEIAFHFQMEKGASQQLFTSDPSMKEAIRILNAPTAYQRILQP